MADLPAIFGNGRYKSYSNAPTTVTDADRVEFRGLLAFDTDANPDVLVYVVVRMDTQQVVWASPVTTMPDGKILGAGSGSISAAPTGPLKVTWNATQGAFAVTKSADIPGVFTPFPVGVVPPIETPVRGILATIAQQIIDGKDTSGLNRAFYNRFKTWLVSFRPGIVEEAVERVGEVYRLTPVPQTSAEHPQAEHPDLEV